MLKLKFKLNKYYLLVHALSQVDYPFPRWENLQNKFWEEFPKAFYLLTTHPEVAFIGDKPFNELTKTCEQIKKMIRKAFKSREFKRLYQESKEYFNFAKNQWQTNGNEALSILEKLSGLKMPDKTITVFITHPKLYRGFAMPAYDIIGFGYAEDWKNSTTVNLCHEIMHYITRNTRIMHAIIELMVNNELRIRLNKKGRYFIFQECLEIKDSPLYRYVGQLRKLEKEIYPFWQDYLKNRRGRNIVDLEKEITKKLKKH